MLALWLSNAILTTHAGTRAFGVFTSAFLIKTLITFVPLQFGSVLLSRLSSCRPKVTRPHRDAPTQAPAGGRRNSNCSGGTIGGWRRSCNGGVRTRLQRRGTDITVVDVVWGLRVTPTLAYLRFQDAGSWLAGGPHLLRTQRVVLVCTALFLAERFGAVGLAWAHTSSWLYGLLALGMLNAIDAYHARVRGEGLLWSRKL